MKGRFYSPGRTTHDKWLQTCNIYRRFTKVYIPIDKTPARISEARALSILDIEGTGIAIDSRSRNFLKTGTRIGDQGCRELVLKVKCPAVRTFNGDVVGVSLMARRHGMGFIDNGTR